MDSNLKLRRVLSEGVSAWLTFEKHSGREGLFSEKYLALPISQILSNHFYGNVEAEHNHPVLTIENKRGRPPQLDFVVRDTQKIVLVAESKWIGASNVNVADVVWDCVRLELAANYYKCESLFILAGEKGKVDLALDSAPFKPKTRRGRATPIMELHGDGRWSVNIQSPIKDYGPALHEHLKSYPHVSFPRSYVCGSGTQTNKTATQKTYVAVVWHIRPEVNKRYTFTVPANNSSN